MTDFDPDAYLTQSNAEPAFDPDAYLSQPAPTPQPVIQQTVPTARAVVRRNPSMVPSSLPSSPASATDLAAAGASGVNSWVADVAGLPMDTATNAANLVKAGIGYPYSKITGDAPPSWLQANDPTNVPGTSEWIKAKTRQAGGAALIDAPRPNGQDLSALHTVGETVGPGPLAGGLGGTVDALTARRAAPINTQAALDAAAANSPQSMGAAASAVRVSDLSPRMQQGFRKAVQETGGAVNPIAATNHAEADLHGVQLMEGQATRDPAQFSNEQNSTNPAIVNRINKQEEQMTDAIDKIRREASPGAVQNNHIENGQIAVDSLKAYDEPIKADIDAKYEAARKASANGDLQMDGSSFVNNANAALKPQRKFRFLPSTAQGILDDVAAAKGHMSLADFQAYSTQLGNEIAKARRAGDGNAEAAITKVYAALQNIEPLGTETAQAKSLFDTARSAAKARFDAMKADPAYEAAVEEVDSGIKRGKPSPLADSFLDKYVIGKGAPKANVDALMSKLDADGKEAVAAHTLSAIRKSAVTPNGKVSADGYNSALAKYEPKLDSLVSPETRESLDSLGRVITNAKVPPPGHFVNTWKSGVIVNAAQGVGEAAINAKTFGLGVPVLKQVIQARDAKRALEPGAGLTKLSELPKP